MEFCVDGLAVLAGGVIALASGAAGHRLRGLSLRRELSGPVGRIEQLEQRLGSFEEATAADLRYLQTAVDTTADRFEKLRPVELQTRLSVVEQSSAAARKDLQRDLERVDESLRQAIADVGALQVADAEGLGRRIDGLGERVDKAASLISQLAVIADENKSCAEELLAKQGAHRREVDSWQEGTSEICDDLEHRIKRLEDFRASQESVRRLLSDMAGSLQGRLDQCDDEAEKLSARIASQEEKLQQAIDGMASVSAAQDQLTTLLEERLGQLQSAITAAQQDAAARRAQLQTPGGPAVMPAIVSPVAQPVAQPSAGFVGVMADLAAAQQQFAERQRAAAAEVFAQPGGGGR